jgi:hypothetical protein
VTVRRIVLLLLAALVLAGCGEASGGTGAGTATLWITRDRGSVLVLDVRVPAGQTLMRALRSKAHVDTRYGGRYVQAIDGVQGSLSAHRDWFWFVNGLAGDESAAEYRLRPGDVAWWDYRDWSHDPELAVVVGAFPEPFLHGYDGKTREVAVRYAPGLRPGARTVAGLLHAVSVAPMATPAPADDDVFLLVTGPARFVAAQRSPGASPSSPVQLTFAGDVARLLFGAYARRFSVP